MIDVAGLALTPEDRDLLRHPAIGGVILFQRNFESLEQLHALTGQIHDVRKPRLLVAVDQEGGRVQRFGEPFSSLPAAGRIGSRYDADPVGGLELAEDCGWLMASELVAAGVDLSFAPVVDIDRGCCEVIGDRAFHSNPKTVSKLAAKVMAGMHEGGMAATAKHFPGHGAVAADSHLTLPVDERPAASMEDDLAPYAALTAKGLDAVMMALVAYPAVDELPASFSRAWIRDCLRNRLGFAGAVFSDDLSMAGAAGLGTMRQRARAALAAGCDMILICNDREAVSGTVDRIDYSDPAGQARRASLHRRHHGSWERLRRSPRWEKARERIARCDERPEFRLDG